MKSVVSKKHYRKKDNTNYKRKVMSYDDTDMENYEENDIKTPFKMTKKFFKISLILISCILFLFVIMNLENLSPNNIMGWIQSSFLGMGQGDGYPVEIFGTSIASKNFQLLNGDIVYVSDTSFVVMNSSANVIIEKQHSFANPVLECKNNYSLIYNLGDKGYQIEKQDKNILKANTEYNIISGAISDNGSYAFVTESKDYLSEMIVYSKDNQEIYKYYFSEYYITDISLKNSGNLGAVSGVYSENGNLKSIVYLFDFSSETPRAFFEYDGVMILDLKYTDSNDLVVVGDSLCSVIDVSGKHRYDYDYEGKELTGFEVGQDRLSLSLSAMSDRRNCDIVVLDNSCKPIFTIETNEKVRAVSANSNAIVLLTDCNIIEYNYKGKIKKEKEFLDNCKNIKLCNNNKVYVLGINEIKLV